MGFVKLLKFITEHPLNKDSKITAILRFAKWQLCARLNPYPIIYPFTENAKLIISKGMTGATQNLYCGLQDFSDMFFLLHFLRRDDLFVDVGANIGSYTVLASAHIKSKTIAFEPIPSTFSNLVKNIHVNCIEDKVKAFNIGLGSKRGILKFSSNIDTLNHVINNDNADTINVEIDTLDSIINDENPLLIKIDVEGYETEVLDGAGKILSNPYLKGIIIELNGSGTRYGFNDEQIHNKLISHGFMPYSYSPLTRKLMALQSYGRANTLYLRDIEFISDRVKHSEKVKILGKAI